MSKERTERRPDHSHGRPGNPRNLSPEEKRLLEEVSKKQTENIRQLIRTGGMLLVKTAETLGPELAKTGLTTSQIRNIYGMVKRMEMSGFDDNEFVLLKPKLAYAAARANKQGARRFAEVMTLAIDEVMESAETAENRKQEEYEKKFRRFVDFFEAILAYHKAAGGRNN